MQSDGNLVLYNSEHTASENAIWSSNTCHKSGFIGSYHLTMQHDGNLVVYDTCNRQMWASDIYHKGSSPHRLVIQNDGNLVIYDANNDATWTPGTKR